MLDQVQRNKVGIEMFNKWLDLIIQQEYIINLVRVYKDAKIMLELETVT